jgi:integrase
VGRAEEPILRDQEDGIVLGAEGYTVGHAVEDWLASDAGVPLEEISQLVGHSGTTVTELVYRHQLKPVIQSGATVMDRLFGA